MLIYSQMYKEADTPRNILTYLPFASCTEPECVNCPALVSQKNIYSLAFGPFV